MPAWPACTMCNTICELSLSLVRTHSPIWGPVASCIQRARAEGPHAMTAVLENRRGKIFIFFQMGTAVSLMPFMLGCLVLKNQAQKITCLLVRCYCSATAPPLVQQSHRIMWHCKCPGQGVRDGWGQLGGAYHLRWAGLCSRARNR